MEATIENALMEIGDLHKSVDASKLREVGAKVFAFVDQKGHVIDFDDAWRWAGYSKKANAKHVLTKNFTAGEDFISHAPVSAPKNEGKHGGHVNPEKIMLTPQCFLKFCLLARTSEGDVLRDFVFVLIRGVKALGAAIQRGEVELRRTGDNHTGDDDSRPLKRLKACESQKGLTAMLKAQGVTGGAVYARINGETNKAVTGLYKGELAKELGLRGSQVNARDYMTKAQLAALELVEVCSAEALNTTGANDDPLEVHKKVLATALTQVMRERFLHGKRATKLCLKDARTPAVAAIANTPVVATPVAVLAAPANAPQCVIKSGNTINNYFGKQG